MTNGQQFWQKDGKMIVSVQHQSYRGPKLKILAMSYPRDGIRHSQIRKSSITRHFFAP